MTHEDWSWQRGEGQGRVQLPGAFSWAEEKEVLFIFFFFFSEYPQRIR